MHSVPLWVALGLSLLMLPSEGPHQGLGNPFSPLRHWALEGSPDLCGTVHSAQDTGGLWAQQAGRRPDPGSLLLLS